MSDPTGPQILTVLAMLAISLFVAIRHDLKNPHKTRTGQINDALDRYLLELDIQKDRAERAALARPDSSGGGDSS